jgi:hypothetical protein
MVLRGELIQKELALNNFSKAGRNQVYCSEG